MTGVRAAGPPGRPGESILIYGRGESPMAVLASALAHQEVGAFGWADCSRPSEQPEPTALRVLEAGSGRGFGPRVPPEELLPPASGRQNLRDWFLDDAADGDVLHRLREYLQLPSVVQSLVSQAPEPEGRAAIVLTNVDTFPTQTLERGFGRTETHATLHREGVTLFVTFRGTPSVEFRTPFNRIYRIEGRPDQLWQEAAVTVERGEGRDGLTRGGSLGERLPWLGLSGTEGEAPHVIPRHRLR